MSLSTVALGDVTQLITKGTTPTTIGGEFADEGIPFVRAQNIVNGSVSFDEDALFIDNATHKLLKRSVIKAGDVLIAIAGTIGRVGIVPDSYEELNCNQAVAIVRVTDRINNQFLKHWIQSNEAIAQIKSSTVVGVISNLSLTQIANLKISLPSIAQQERIAAILNKADEIRAKSEQLIAKLDELASTMFEEDFVGKGYEQSNLSSICNLITDGTHYTPKDIQTGFPFLTVKDMTSEGLDFDGCSFISMEDFVHVKSGNCSPCVGDILFSKDGTVGKVHVVNESREFGVLSSIAILRPNQSLVYPEFLGCALKSQAILSSALAKKTGAAIRRIILANLKDLKIPIPPLHVQLDFVKKIETLKKVRLQCREQLIKNLALVESLQSQAFTTGFNT